MTIDLEVLKKLLEESCRKYKRTSGGENASYIPYLAQVAPDLCALSVVTVDGHTLSAGDSEFRFAIESISKVCTLALALEDVGPETVRKKVGTEATGLPFNSVIALELHKGKPLSPLVNAGAMSTTSLIKADSTEERWRRILDIQRQLTSDSVCLSDEVNKSEQDTNFHNRAIAWLLYSADAMYCDPMEACDVYTRQCSTLITTTELATLGATLASRGVNPISGKRVLREEHTPHILAEMTMEGLYDSSGAWAYSVGLPGKSGVGGGILAVVPGVMGIAGFSPPLDECGNSVRGQKMVAEVADTLGFNLYNQTAHCATNP